MRSGNRYQALSEPEEPEELCDELKNKIEDGLNTLKDRIGGAVGKEGKKSDENGVCLIIAQVLDSLKPIVVDAVVSAVTDVLSKHEDFRRDVRQLKTENVILQERLERLEQYTRKEQVKIFGLPCREPEENTDKVIIDLAGKMGVQLQEDDISVSHRLPARGGKPPPLIVKFVSRNTRAKLMTNKRKLKEAEGYSSVFLADNLTPQRSKLLRKLKTHPKVKSLHGL